MLGYPQKRPADIPLDWREIFERLGEAPIQMTLASGYTPRSEQLVPIYQDGLVRQYAERWLTEQIAERHRHEWRIERVEWAIVILVFIEVLFDVARLFRWISK